jgi:hypothetical protein
MEWQRKVQFVTAQRVPARLTAARQISARLSKVQFLVPILGVADLSMAGRASPIQGFTIQIDVGFIRQ